MEIDFQKLMDSKSDEGLEHYLENREKYTPAAIEAAIAELQKRGRAFEESELSAYHLELKERRQGIAIEEREFLRSNKQWNKNVVKDKSAPAYFSERTIYAFSILFSVVFGAVLLSMNLRSTESKKGITEVIVFGIGYTVFQIWVLSLVEQNSILTLTFSAAGALLLNRLFWKKYIGGDTKYRAKPIWKPLLIGLLILVPIIYYIISRPCHP